MEKEQLKVVITRKVNRKGEEETTIWSAETQITNFIYQTLNETKNDISLCYGEEGFNKCASKYSGSYKFKNEDFGIRFLKKNIKQYSSKISLILDNIEKSDGPVFIFSKYLWGGLIPILIALEMNAMLL